MIDEKTTGRVTLNYISDVEYPLKRGLCKLLPVKVIVSYSVNPLSWYSAWHLLHSLAPVKVQYSNILSSLHKECLFWHAVGCALH